ncbi:MAG: BON domain-containing protein [Acidobacteria bacterium]|nr:MAG: BON domain-containing protein [Acidobacteriota bacterium]RPJ77311.1 MAG: BON domain-containing protein [Acidobacteriota bacterium]
MMGGLLRAVLLLVLLVAVVVGVGAFLLGYRVSDFRTGEPVRTSGRDAGDATAGTAGTARERGAEIGERVGAAADRAGEMLSDGAVTAKIKSKMALDDTIEARHINVSTRDNVVTLSGTVASARQRERAVQLAKETEGVKSVKDELRIRK